MANPYKMFETDAQAEVQGVRIYYPSQDAKDRYWFVVARAGGKNDAFIHTLRQRLDRITRGGQITNNAQADKISRNTFLEMCLRGWGSDKHGDGLMIGRNDTALEFNADNTDAFFRDLPDLLADIIRQVQSGELFRKEGIEADAGN
jgi:hypothetical protein